MAVASDAAAWRLFETAFQQSKNPMSLVDGNRRLIRVNPALIELVGYKPSDVLGRDSWDFVADDRPSVEEWRAAVYAGDMTGSMDVVSANGEIVHTQFAVHPDIVGGQRVVLMVTLNASRWGRHFRRGDTETSGHLSDREREVVQMVAMGATSPEIAKSLHISPHTVRKHVNSAMNKVGARSRAQLVAKVLVATATGA